MPMLQVADFPADIYSRISAQALRENITFEQELIFLLKNSLPPQETANQIRRRAVFQRVKARSVPLKTDNLDVANIISDMREERTQQVYDCCH